jgi:hypothetical protein
VVNLFINIDGKRKISHLVISDYCEVEEAAILKFIHTKAKEFEALGDIVYEKTTFEDEEGFSDTAVCYLNPRQAWLLIRYFKQTEPVLAFKVTFKSALKTKEPQAFRFSDIKTPLLVGLSTSLALICII